MLVSLPSRRNIFYILFYFFCRQESTWTKKRRPKKFFSPLTLHYQAVTAPRPDQKKRKSFQHQGWLGKKTGGPTTIMEIFGFFFSPCLGKRRRAFLDFAPSQSKSLTEVFSNRRRETSVLSFSLSLSSFFLSFFPVPQNFLSVDHPLPRGVFSRFQRFLLLGLKPTKVVAQEQIHNMGGNLN